MSAAKTGKSAKLRDTMPAPVPVQPFANYSGGSRVTMFSDQPRPVRLLIGIFFLIVTCIAIYIVAKGIHDGVLTIPRKGFRKEVIVRWDENPVRFWGLALGYSFATLMCAFVSFGGWKSFLGDD